LPVMLETYRRVAAGKLQSNPAAVADGHREHPWVARG
jgi:hypothetical protein